MPEDGYPNTDAGKLSARKRLAESAYLQTPKNYRPERSHCQDILSNTELAFFMFDFMRNDWADCRDLSSWWVKLCNSLGLDGQMRRINNPYNLNNRGFWTKPIKIIGADTWTPTWWLFHQIGFYVNVYDPCVQIASNTGWVRVPQDENVTLPYRRDLWDTSEPGTWELLGPISIVEVH